MTTNEAIIARIAMRLGHDLAKAERDPFTYAEVQERFIEVFRPERPCRYALACVETGSCPFDPVCNS